jgi:hypothetical protein
MAAPRFGAALCCPKRLESAFSELIIFVAVHPNNGLRDGELLAID